MTKDEIMALLTPAQKQEMLKGASKYPRRYWKWVNAMKRSRLGYATLKEMLEDLYKERTVHDIGRLLGFTGMSVCNMMKKLGVARRSRPEKDPSTWFVKQGRRSWAVGRLRQ